MIYKGLIFPLFISYFFASTQMNCQINVKQNEILRNKAFKNLNLSKYPFSTALKAILKNVLCSLVLQILSHPALIFFHLLLFLPFSSGIPISPRIAFYWKPKVFIGQPAIPPFFLFIYFFFFILLWQMRERKGWGEGEKKNGFYFALFFGLQFAVRKHANRARTIFFVFGVCIERGGLVALKCSYSVSFFSGGKDGCDAHRRPF